MNTKVKKKISALHYFGGKTRHLDWLLPLLEVEHKNYVEPFCGGASVFLNKKHSPIETINDKEGRIINFFRVLREQPEKLISQLQLTPYSRQEFITGTKAVKNRVEDARRFFVALQQSFGGNFYSRKNSWRINLKESRNGVSLEVSKYLNKVDGLHKVAERLRMAQIENRDAFDIIKIYDGPDTLFYVDPPYLPAVRTGSKDYAFEFTAEQHQQLAQLINNSKGKFAISTYDNEMYDQWYPSPKWFKTYDLNKIVNLGKSKKREVVYTNYQPGIVMKLF